MLVPLLSAVYMVKYTYGLFRNTTFSVNVCNASAKSGGIANLALYMEMSRAVSGSWKALSYAKGEVTIWETASALHHY